MVRAYVGDYVYPAELRFNPATGRVYARTRGLAGGICYTTVIYEFDLARRQETEHVNVDDSILPALAVPSLP